MRRLAAFTVILVAALLLLLLQRMGDEDRAATERETARESAWRSVEERQRRPITGESPTVPEPNGSELFFPPLRAEPDPGPTSGRLVYRDGAPAANILLTLAACHPFETKQFRNGDYTQKTIFLVTHQRITTTDADGRFRFRGIGEAPHARRFVFTDRDGPAALVVAELLGTNQTVVARRRVQVTGVLRDKDGRPEDNYVFRAELGEPEDWQARPAVEPDSFVTATEDLHVDAAGATETVTDSEGRFTLLLAEGRNTLTFGYYRMSGTQAIDVPAHDFDAGELTVPGGPSRSKEPRTLRGTVLSLAGAPFHHAEVRCWDGSVGEPTHVQFTDAKGRFEFDELFSPHVILWAVSVTRPHLDLPEQSSGTIRMPCSVPVVLRAPEASEYCWARPVGITGFFLFERNGVWLGGDALTERSTVGLPLGTYRIAVVEGSRVLEARLVIDAAGERPLQRSEFEGMH